MNSKELKDFAGSKGVDCVGIIGPDGLGIQDKFNWARAVIVLGVYSLDENVDAILRQEYKGKKNWSKWIYEIIDGKAMKVCMLLREQGFKALYSRQIDLRQAAKLAGIGAAGRNQMLITPEAGPRIRLVVIMTDASLEFDKPFTQELCKDCDICIKACPNGALSEAGFERSKCLGEFSPTPELAARQRKTDKSLSECIRIQCLKCMVACPVGKDLKTRPFDVTD
ncbi:4Fe-4S binding protein [Planctomycetota bacterium]